MNFGRHFVKSNMLNWAIFPSKNYELRTVLQNEPKLQAPSVSDGIIRQNKPILDKRTQIQNFKNNSMLIPLNELGEIPFGQPFKKRTQNEPIFLYADRCLPNAVCQNKAKYSHFQSKNKDCSKNKPNSDFPTMKKRNEPKRKAATLKLQNKPNFFSVTLCARSLSRTRSGMARNAKQSQISYFSIEKQQLLKNQTQNVIPNPFMGEGSVKIVNFLNFDICTLIFDMNYETNPNGISSQ
jgi:hypothetical protein